MVKYINNNSGFQQWNAARDASGNKSRLGGILWWFILFLAAWWLLSWWMAPNSAQTDTDETPVEMVDLSGVPVSEIKSENITANVQGLRISNIKLLDYTADAADDNTGPVVLLGAENTYALVGINANGTDAPTQTTVWTQNGDTYTWRNSDGVDFSRQILVDGYVISVTDTVNNASDTEISIAPYAEILRANDMESSAGVYTGAVAFVNNDLEHEDWTRIADKSFAYTTTNGFIGFVDQYWETVLSVSSPDQTMRVRPVGDLFSVDTISAPVQIAPGETHTMTTHLYMGPRDHRILQGADTLISGIDQTVDYGWFWFFVRPILWLLHVLNSFVMNYGVAIIIMTLLLRLAMWPLTRKSYVSMMAMQKMQPEMARIQKLYANDKARMQMEMMRLYQTHKTSPMSGCLPMLIQIPIFFALYKALLISVQMRSAHFLWISDLASMDPYFILPILMGLTMWLQQHLQTVANNKNAAPNDVTAQTQKMMKWMPLLFTVMFAWMPAGLVLYWTVSNIFGIGQMYYIKKVTRNL